MFSIHIEVLGKDPRQIFIGDSTNGLATMACILDEAPSVKKYVVFITALDGVKEVSQLEVGYRTRVFTKWAEKPEKAK